MIMKVKNDLLGYKGLKIIQNTDYFSFSLDSVLLPNFVKIPKNCKNVLDIGTGNAPIPLILTTKTDAEITAIEVQKEIFEMAKETNYVPIVVGSVRITPDWYMFQLKLEQFVETERRSVVLELVDEFVPVLPSWKKLEDLESLGLERS